MQRFFKKHLEIISDIFELISYSPPTSKEPVNKRQFVSIK